MLQSASDLLETYSTLSLVATPKKQLNSRIRQSNTPKLVKICQSGKNFVNFQRKESILISDIASIYSIFLGGWCQRLRGQHVSSNMADKNSLFWLAIRNLIAERRIFLFECLQKFYLICVQISKIFSFASISCKKC